MATTVYEREICVVASAHYVFQAANSIFFKDQAIGKLGVSR